MSARWSGKPRAVRAAVVVAIAAFVVPALLFLFMMTKESGGVWAFAILAALAGSVVTTALYAVILLRTSEGRHGLAALALFGGGGVLAMRAARAEQALLFALEGIGGYLLVVLAIDLLLRSIGVTVSRKPARARAAVLLVIATPLVPVLGLAIAFSRKTAEATSFAATSILVVVVVVTAASSAAFWR